MDTQPNYNPLTDASFWVALVLGGGSLLLILLSGKPLSDLAIITNAVFFVVWEGWILLKKGRKWGLLVGFVLAAIAAAAIMYVMLPIEEQQQKAQSDATMQQALQNISQQQSTNVDAFIQGDFRIIQPKTVAYFAASHSFSGLCADTGLGSVGKILVDVQKSNGNIVPTCNASATAFAISSPLLSDSSKFWCMDSTGYIGEASSQLGAVTVCPIH